MIKERNIVLAVVLSLVTCGIYGIIWMVSMTDEAASLNNDSNMKGITAFLLTLVTCGIYGYYWAYKMGKTMNEAGTKKGTQIEDRAVLYLILQICGLGIVNYCLIQSDLNKFATPAQQ